MGKGDSYRPIDLEKFGRNYDRIFGGGTDEEQRAPANEDSWDDDATGPGPKSRSAYKRLKAQGYDVGPAPWDDDACDEELARDDNFCLDCMGHVCTCEEDENVC